MRTSSLSTCLVAGALVLATGCGGATDGGSGGYGERAGTGRSAATSAPAAGAATLRISGFAFGDPLTVSPGQTITIVNGDGAPHTVTADSGDAFDVSVAGNATATMTAPRTPGSYPFHCAVHPRMKGTLTVR